MNQQTHAQSVEKDSRGGKTVLVIGGNGGLSGRYRDVAQSHGLSLRHYETKVPPGARRDAGKIALVVIMVNMVSHALRDQVANLGIDGAPVLYLRSASISALRGALEQFAA
ncbi:MAG: DUF2325 domain-containing protein [Polyangiaceae bacterium]|nr:DUF2325 domain-containing protein [Polyangiaceae bacterium]